MPQTLEAVRISTQSAGAPFLALAWTVFGRHPWVRRDYVEILAVVEGEGKLNVLGTAGLDSTALRPGVMFFLRPRDRYQIVGASHEGVSGYVVSASLPHWMSFSQLIGLDSNWLASQGPPRIDFDPDDRGVAGAFDRIIRKFRKHPSMLDLVEFWAAIVPTLLSGDSRQRANAAPRWLTEAIDAMRAEENLVRGVPRFLELARVTPSYLSRAVRRYFGMTPTELVMGMRTQHAAILLSTTTKTIAAIAHQCGFVSASYFTASFRRAMGATPGAYRREHRGDVVQGFDDSVNARPWPDLPLVTGPQTIEDLEEFDDAAPLIRTALRWD